MNRRRIETPDEINLRTFKEARNGKNILSDEELLSGDSLLNETIFSEHPIEEKEVPGKKGSASQDRLEKKKYKDFVSSPDDIKKVSLFIANIILNVNTPIKDRRMHLSDKEALSIAEPGYRLFDRHVIARVKSLIPDLEDGDANDVKEILAALGSWGL